MNAFEISYMVRNGMSRIDAIRSSARVAAEALRLDGEVGTLETGKRADAPRGTRRSARAY
jgi:imidazolonepropionase-like amidohydrolase